jgi:hypothetical protein
MIRACSGNSAAIAGANHRECWLSIHPHAQFGFSSIGRLLHVVFSDMNPVVPRRIAKPPTLVEAIMKSIPCNGELLAGQGLCCPIRFDKKELDIERTNSEYDRLWQSPSNRERGTGPGILWHTTLSGRSPRCVQARVCAPRVHERRIGSVF